MNFRDLNYAFVRLDKIIAEEILNDAVFYDIIEWDVTDTICIVKTDIYQESFYFIIVFDEEDTMFYRVQLPSNRNATKDINDDTAQTIRDAIVRITRCMEFVKEGF